VKRKYINLETALRHAMSRELKGTFTSREHNTVSAEFTDGSKITWESSYEGPISEVTPGDGLQPPEIWLDLP